MKILLWKTGALGDVLMTTPLLRQVRGAWPQARIEYLVGRGSAQLVQEHAAVDAVHTFDERILYGGQARRLGEVLPLLRGYDRMFILDKHWIFTLLARASLCPDRIGFARRPLEGLLHTRKVTYGPIRHEIDYYLDLLECTGASVDRADRHLQVPVGRPCTLPPAYSVLVNGGGNNANEQSNVRRMPDALFRALCETRRAQGPLVFLGTPDERAYYDAFCATGDANLCGSTDLAQATWALQHAQAVFTTDTGLMHMAAAVNGNVTAIFGPTHPLRKCPPGARWVWTDQARYDDRYELLGRVPQGRFFTQMTVADILG